MMKDATNKLKSSFASLGFYAGRLRKERLTKAVFASMAVVALVLQLFVGVLPFNSTAAHATGSDNIISQGASNKADLLAIYDRGVDAAGHGDIKQIYTAMGISREDLANGTIGSYNTNDFNGSIKTLGRTNWPNAGRTQLTIAGAQTTVYTGPFLDGYNAKTYPMPALIGKRSMDGQWFAITLNCGNVVYVTPPTPPAPKPVYTCDMLTVDQINRTTFKFTTKSTATNATVQSITYVIKDVNGKELSRSSNDTYVQTTPGAYSVQAIVNVTANGKSDTATSANCTKSFNVEKEKTPGISITKLVDGVKSKTVGVNQEFTYQVTVKNTGETDLTNATVSDTAPAGVTFIKSDTGSVSGNAWTTTISSLKIGESKSFAITAKVAAFQSGNIVNTACVTASDVSSGEKKCDTATVDLTPPVTPAAPVVELPHTGFGASAGAVLGVGSVVAALGYYGASRRNLLSAFLNR
jgi:uncharacterized repeat protein (TIGR01451 family)/LPXTG-motif cell wall-anchored protein